LQKCLYVLPVSSYWSKRFRVEQLDLSIRMSAVKWIEISLTGQRYDRTSGSSPLSEPLDNLRFEYLISITQLIPESPPPIPQVVSSPKQFNFPSFPFPAQNSFDHIVKFVGLARGLSNFGEEDLGVETFVEPFRESERFRRIRTSNGNETMLCEDRLVSTFAECEDRVLAYLLRMIQPMTRSTCKRQHDISFE